MRDSELPLIAAGHVRSLVPAEVLVQCEKGHWRSVISALTLFRNPGHYAKVARSCQHFSTK